MATYELTGYADVNAVINALDAAGLALPASGGTIGTYTETGGTLTISSGVLTIPIDGKIYKVDVTEEITSIVTTGTPSAPNCRSVIVYFVQGSPGYSVSYPAAWEWPGGTITDIDSSGGAKTRLILMTDPDGVIQANAEMRSASS